MENATDALKMAASVLMFIMALSVAIVSFGNVRKTADAILDIRDRETEYIDGNFYYKESKENARTVGLETVIPTIYRVYFENYRIVFENLDDEPLYTNKKDKDNGDRKSLDLSYETNIINGQDTSKIKLLLNAIVYGINEEYKEEYTNLYGRNVELPSESLYTRLQKKINNGYQIVEHLGVYYQNDGPNVPETNKIEKRVITYEIVKK